MAVTAYRCPARRFGQAIAVFALFWASLSFPPAAATAETKNAVPGPNPLAAVVRLKTQALPEARTAPYLGHEREGSGVVIDASGLVLTIGYLVLEADRIEVTDATGKTHAATLIAYDHATGFGLVRTVTPVRVPPIELGDASQLKARDEVLIAGFGGPSATAVAMVVSRRQFTGAWEYLLENAIFTVPPVLNWGGAALIGRDGRLLGIGSLLVPDAVEPGVRFPGNMFVPIDPLKPILADLLDDGRRAGPPRPWLGLSTEEIQGRLFVVRVAPEGPADRAGIRPNDIVTGLDGEPFENQADFYRKLWAKGPAGTVVRLQVLQGNRLKEISVTSMNREEYLRVKQAY
jgi:S1-C subfamily serine protease